MNGVIKQGHFSTDHLQADLKGRSVRGGATTVASQASKFILHLGSTMILARLLTPGDYGLIAMVAVIIGFVGLFKDLGLSTATVQRAEINHDQVSTLFWVNVGISVLLMLITASLAPTVAWFYDEPRLTAITLVFAVVFLFGGLSAQHQALLRRQMRFSALAVVDVASMVGSILIGVTLAWMGAGYWALVAMNASMTLINVALLWIICDWRPGPPKRASDVRSLLAFGGNLTGFRVLNYFSRNLDNALIGWKWGAEPLGLYSKAYHLLMLPIHQINNPLTAVAVPALSRLQNEPLRYRRFYQKAVGSIVTFGMPIIGFSLVAADNIVGLILGQQWLGAVPIFRALGIAAFIGTFNVAGGWVYVSLGRVDRQLRWGMIGCSVNTLAILIGLHWGPLGVAMAFSVSQLILQIPGLLYCFNGTPLKLRHLGEALWRPAVASISAAAILSLINNTISDHLGLFWGLLIGVMIYSLLYISLWLLMPNGKNILLELMSLVHHFKAEKRLARS